MCADGDQCDPPPCLNGGVCQDGMSSYLCWCKPNFRGKNCEIGKCDEKQNTEFIRKTLLYNYYCLIFSPLFIDINQCSINNGGCMHFCVMQAQRVVCHCAAGYKLGLDKTSCEPTGKTFSIYNYIFILIIFCTNHAAP